MLHPRPSPYPTLPLPHHIFFIFLCSFLQNIILFLCSLSFSLSHMPFATLFPLFFFFQSPFLFFYIHSQLPHIRMYARISREICTINIGLEHKECSKIQIPKNNLNPIKLIKEVMNTIMTITTPVLNQCKYHNI